LALVVVGLALSVPLAVAQEAGDDDAEGRGGGALGVAATVAVVAVGITALLNFGRRRFLLPALRGDKDAIKTAMRLHRKVWLPVHLVTGLATLALGILHGLAEGHGNWMLWTSMAAFGFLTVGGALLAWKWTPANVRKGVYLLHTQQVVFVATLVLLVVGHALE
jgi:hypothetical protein